MEALSFIVRQTRNAQVVEVLREHGDQDHSTVVYGIHVYRSS